MSATTNSRPAIAKILPALAVALGLTLTACSGGAADTETAPQEVTAPTETEVQEVPIEDIDVDGEFVAIDQGGRGGVFTIPEDSPANEYTVSGQSIIAEDVDVLAVTQLGIWTPGDNLENCGTSEALEWMDQWFESHDGPILISLVSNDHGAIVFGDIDGLAVDMVAAGYAVPRGPGQEDPNLAEPEITENDAALEVAYDKAEADNAGLHGLCEINRNSTNEETGQSSISADHK